MGMGSQASWESALVDWELFLPTSEQKFSAAGCIKSRLFRMAAVPRDRERVNFLNGLIRIPHLGPGHLQISAAQTHAYVRFCGYARSLAIC